MHVRGIHHITAISSDPQKTYDFYTGTLGLRLVKKSVNQDDPGTYHLFFGNRVGSPGMDLTFFPFGRVIQGQRGVGQVTTISMQVPTGALGFWEQRLDERGVRREAVTHDFGLARLMFYDNDDQRLELVEVTDIDEEYNKAVWTTPEVSSDYAIRCFHSATLSVLSADSVSPVLELMGYVQVARENMLTQYQIEGRTSAAYLVVEELVDVEDPVGGAGTVHHIAYEVADRAEQELMREALVTLGEQPTHVIDRYYFTSVYFRMRAGILFELATHGPGFTADEDEAQLGERLALPPFLEPHRSVIETHLSPIQTS